MRATDGDPIATSIREVSARILDGAPAPPLIEVRTDAAGRATIPPTPFPIVAVSAPGRATVCRVVGREIERRDACEERFRLAPAFPLAGRVLDEAGRPAARADVAALPEDPGAQLRDPRMVPHAHCDDAGVFAIDDVGPGRHLLVARAPGRCWAATVWIRMPGVERIDVRMPPTGVLEGRVTSEETRRPVAGARVWISDPARCRSTYLGVETDSAGRYRFEGVAAGTLDDLWAEAPGFVPARSADASVGSDGIVPGGTLRHDFVLSKGATAAGSVTCDGSPVADAEVEIAVETAHFEERQSARTTTATDGTWRVEGLGAGSAVVIVRHESFVQPEEPDPRRAGDTEAAGVDQWALAVPAKGVVRREVRLLRAAPPSVEPPSDDVPEELTRIRGRAVGPDGAPIPESVVGVEWRSPGRRRFPLRSRATGDDPRVVRDRTGPWNLTVPKSTTHADSCLAFAATYADGYAESALHRVPTGADEVALHFRIGAPVRLRGRVVRAGAAVQGAWVQVVSPRDHLSLRRAFSTDEPGGELTEVHAVSGADGWFSVPVARPGRYVVAAATHDLARGVVRHVVVPGGPVEVRLPAVAEISGRVEWPDATPCAGLLVAAVSVRRQRSYGPDSDGVEGPGWAMTRADGSFRLRGMAVGAPKCLEIGRHRTGRQNVPTLWTDPIDPGTHDVRITVERGRSLRGRVVSPQGAALSGVSVLAWNVDDPWRSTLQTTCTGVDGDFVIDALGAPPWRVEVYAFALDLTYGARVGGPETRVLYPGTFDDSGPIELVLDVPTVRPCGDAGEASPR